MGTPPPPQYEPPGADSEDKSEPQQQQPESGDQQIAVVMPETYEIEEDNSYLLSSVLATVVGVLCCNWVPYILLYYAKKVMFTQPEKADMLARWSVACGLTVAIGLTVTFVTWFIVAIFL